MRKRTHSIHMSLGLKDINQTLSVFDMTDAQQQDMVQMEQFLNDTQCPILEGQLLMSAQDRSLGYEVKSVVHNPSINPQHPYDTTVVVLAIA